MADAPQEVLDVLDGWLEDERPDGTEATSEQVARAEAWTRVREYRRALGEARVTAPNHDAASVPREQYERVVAALDQAVETLDLATAALAAGKLPERAILTAKLLDATRELRASVGTAIAGGDDV